MSRAQSCLIPVHPVILAGGSGTRLWPVSRTQYPKQFLPLHSESSLLQETVSRVATPGFAAPLMICSEDGRFIVAEQLRQLAVAPAAIIIEPEGRNTAPAAAVAALILGQQAPDALILLLPSDHVIEDTAAFREVVARAAMVAAQGYIVTFGIAPRKPETGYGYIQRGPALAEAGDAFAVAAFVEKPDLATATRFLQNGDYFCNSGMFLFPAGLFLAELERLSPDMVAHSRAALAALSEDGPFRRLGPEPFRAIVANSIDYAVMEHTDKAAMVIADIGWSDVGSWAALWEIGAQDQDGNVVSGDVLLEDTRNCYVQGDGRLVATLGIEDLVVVDSADALLVAARDRVQDVKTIVERLKRLRRPESVCHRRVYRPWGWYQTLDIADRFQVKQITVNTGQRLSLQAHFHRAEHWVVVSGTARITCGDKVTLLTENQSTYVPLGVTHRLENPGRIPLRLIEIQVGPYLGEDDIVRYDDVYGRL